MLFLLCVLVQLKIRSVTSRPFIRTQHCYDTCCFSEPCPPGLGCPANHTLKSQTCHDACCVPDDAGGSCCRLSTAPSPGPRPGPNHTTLALPTKVQQAWQDLEFGSLNSFQMVTFWPPQLNQVVCLRACARMCIQNRKHFFVAFLPVSPRHRQQLFLHFAQCCIKMCPSSKHSSQLRRLGNFHILFSAITHPARVSCHRTGHLHWVHREISRPNCWTRTR